MEKQNKWVEEAIERLQCNSEEFCKKMEKAIECLGKYEKAMIRLNRLGVKTDVEAIAHLENEIDYYREKIRSMEERNNVRADLKDAFRYATMSIMPAEATEAKMPILESIPKDMRDRVYSIEQNRDGDITVYFDTEGKENEKNKRTQRDT